LVKHLESTFTSCSHGAGAHPKAPPAAFVFSNVFKENQHESLKKSEKV
jgi:hypothetical protein